MVIFHRSPKTLGRPLKIDTADSLKQTTNISSRCFFFLIQIHPLPPPPPPLKYLCKYRLNPRDAFKMYFEPVYFLTREILIRLFPFIYCCDV